jgi:hypothetical protein
MLKATVAWVVFFSIGWAYRIPAEGVGVGSRRPASMGAD